MLRFLCLGVAALAAVCAASPAVAQADETSIDLLFVQNAGHGRLDPVGGSGQYRLTLRGVPLTVWFQNSPGSSSGQVLTRRFVRHWAALGFSADPPNAALTATTTKGRRRHTAVVKLSAPRVNSRRHALVYHADFLSHAGGRRTFPKSFEDVTLAIDDGTAQVVNGCVIQPFTRCTGVDLQGASLAGADLSYADLDNANLESANLSGANLGNASFSQANLILANLSNANAQYSRAYYANFGDATLTGANFLYAQLTGSQFPRAIATGATLAGSDLSIAGLTSANLSSVNFNGTKLDETNFTGSTLTGATFTQATFTDVTCPNGTVVSSPKTC